MLTGAETPDQGEVDLGDTVDMGYVDQSRDTLNGEKTVWEEVSDEQDILRIGRYEIQSRAYVGRFNFKGSDQQKRVGDLSGGERNRVHLASLPTVDIQENAAIVNSLQRWIFHSLKASWGSASLVFTMPMKVG